MNTNQEVRRILAKIKRVTANVYNNTGFSWLDSRTEADRIIITDLISIHKLELRLEKARVGKDDTTS